LNDEWWRGAVIYQIYPRSFRDSNQDGIGDLRGIIEKLPYVASLGVDGIWLSPFYVSPMADFGYDVADYCAVDPLFGTLADFDELVGVAHRLGLKVVIDLVCAHTSDRHPWFAESRASRGNARADWYVWADPRVDGTPPNNWLSVFGGGAWAWEPRRRQYYLHHFLPSQPKLNLRNEAVLGALLAVTEFWLERGVDGFRLDAVDFLVHDEALTDNPPFRGLRQPVKPYHMQQHLYDLGAPGIRPVIEKIRAFMDRYPGAVSIAEVGSETTDASSLARAGGYVGEDDRGVHAAYSLSQMKSKGDAPTLRDAIAEAERAFPRDGLIWAFSNHDVARVTSRWGDGSAAAAKMFMALLLSLRGGVFIYQGEELGLPEADVPFERLQDPYGRHYWPDFRGRDGCRTPMPWCAESENAGFSNAHTPWLPIPEAHRKLAVSAQECRPDSVLSTSRELLQLRRKHPALRHGRLDLLDVPPPLLAFRRRADAECLLCVFNIGSHDAEFIPPNTRLTPLDGFAAIDGECRIRLPGYGAYIAQEDDSG